MKLDSQRSGHWTDDQLIAHLYGVGPEDGHATLCRECQARLVDLSAVRGAREKAGSTEPDGDFLAAQRRTIYARLSTQSPKWHPHVYAWRWASAIALASVLGGSAFYYENYQHRQILENQVSDVQLAMDVSHMSAEAEAQPTAPLQALFE